MNRHRIVAIIFLVASVAAVLVIREVISRRQHSSLPTVQIPIGGNKVAPKVVSVWPAAFLLASDGSLWGWGKTRASGLLARNAADDPLPTPRRLGTNADWIDLAVTRTAVVLLHRDRTLWTWDVYATNSSPGFPVQISTNAGWRSIDSGLFHVMALREDGSLWAWGENNYGQIGDGAIVRSSGPVPIGTNRNWSALAPGYFHNLAVQSNGTLWCWGRIDPTQPSAPNPLNTSQPVQFDEGTNWAAVALGEGHSFAQKSDGSFCFWGPSALAAFRQSQVSNGLVCFSPLADVAKLAAGGLHCFALRRDGTLWGLGFNTSGALAGLTNGQDWVQIEGRKDWIDVWSGAGASSFALAADGTLWTWGVKLGEPNRFGFDERIAQWVGRLRGVFGNRTAAGRSYDGSPPYTATPWPIARFVTNNVTPTDVGPK